MKTRPFSPPRAVAFGVQVPSAHGKVGDRGSALANTLDAGRTGTVCATTREARALPRRVP
ncbi:MAG: hypothetical protein C5B58_11485 [Acidobacteria bacterium]|nr:MAG: hypothetical protein C5B58_11485 [Acidobacteriota bacterium]